ncbi:MAG: hypothetical protein ACKN9V_01165 [Pseudomonadota bacterium]
MSSLLIKKKGGSDEIKSGLFSKQEGAQAIISGVRHIHSSLLGVNDPCWKVTQSRLQNHLIAYPWELSTSADGLILTNSTQRSDCWDRIISSTAFGQESQNRERLKLVTEELLSNSFYHSYKNQKQQDKYDRMSPVQLNRGEEIKVLFKENPSGLHLVIEDQGGSLTFKDFIASFSRCFQQTPTHMSFDQKHAGAGLGLFLVYQTVSHLCISIDPGKQSRLSLWLSNTNQYDPDSFSFNFFGA